MPRGGRWLSQVNERDEGAGKRTRPWNGCVGPIIDDSHKSESFWIIEQVRSNRGELRGRPNRPVRCNTFDWRLLQRASTASWEIGSRWQN